MSGPIKIGRADNPRRRVADLGVSTPIEVIFIGALFSEHADHEEKGLHQKLAAHHVKGEWFEADAVLSEIKQLGFRVLSPDQVDTLQPSRAWRRNINLHLRVTPEEFAAWKSAADLQNKSVSEWMRSVMNPPAEEIV
jgi:hypothetical protein